PLRDPHRARELILRGLASMVPGELPEHKVRQFELLDGWVCEGQRNGEFRTDFESCELAGFVMGLQFQATLTRALGFIPGDVTEHMDRVLRLAMEGIQRRDAG